MMDTLSFGVAQGAERETVFFLLNGHTPVNILKFFLKPTSLQKNFTNYFIHQGQCCGNSGFHI